MDTLNKECTDADFFVKNKGRDEDVILTLLTNDLKVSFS